MACQPQSVPAALACAYIRNQTDACGGGGFVDYSAAVWCLDGAGRVAVVAASLLWLAALFATLSVAADSFFCPCIATISRLLGISENIAGVTFLAFGNGAPDIFSSLASVISSETPKPGLAFGALMGSGMFLTTLVAGVVTLIQPFDVMRRPLIRDLFFYLLALSGTLTILLRGVVYKWETIGFLILYCVYVAVVVVGRWVRMRSQERRVVSTILVEDDVHETAVASLLQRGDSFVAEALWRGHPPPLPDEEEEEKVEEVEPAPNIYLGILRGLQPFSSRDWRAAGWPRRVLLLIRAPLELPLRATIPVVDYETEPVKGGWSQPLAVSQAVLAPFLALLFTQNLTTCLGGIHAWVFAVPIGLLLALAVLTTSVEEEPPLYHKLMAFVGFVMAVLWIFGVAREVVGIVTMFGSLCNASEDVLGLTVLAWANSLGDLVSDVSVAKSGYPRMALSACIGGPLFNLLVGFGLSFSIAAWKVPMPVTLTGVRALLLGFLAVSLVANGTLLAVSRFRATRLYASFLLLLYIVFLATVLMADYGVFRLPGLP